MTCSLLRSRTARLALPWLLVLGLAHCSSDPKDSGESSEPSGDNEPSPDAGRASDASMASDARRPAAPTDASARDAKTATAPDAKQPDPPGAGDAGPSADAGKGNADAGTPSSSDAGTGQGSATAIALTTPPTYLGTRGGDSTCATTFHTLGYAPADTSKKHPLFLYFAGTSSGAADVSSRYDSQGSDRVNIAMAERGFVALSVEYDNGLTSFFADKQPCLFGTGNAQSLLATACALPSVDCALGIATWGHSQGALLAHAAANFDPRVRAVWTTGYSGMSGAKLSYSRFRTVNGEGDTLNAQVATANTTAGFTDADKCPDDGRDECLRSDGSGWIIVRKSACKTNAADHCWFNKKSCSENAETLEPNWVDATSSQAFALDENADWVATTVARP